MPDNISAKTGNAPVKRLGHTKGNMYGNNINAQKVGKNDPQDLKAK